MRESLASNAVWSLPPSVDDKNNREMTKRPVRLAAFDFDEDAARVKRTYRNTTEPWRKWESISVVHVPLVGSKTTNEQTRS